jgi:isoquinoline 1-oxidoreductase beta subunit
MATARKTGDVLPVLGSSRRRVDATYTVPYLAHATMEPVNCTVAYAPGKAEVWVGTQVPGFAVGTVAKIGGLSPDAVTLHTPFLGGGFGRRLEVDFIAKASLIAKNAGRPVKTIYTRENDIRGDLYRSASFSRLSAALSGDGLPNGWHHRIAAGSIYSRYFPPMVKDGVDESSVEGAHDLLYAIPNQLVELAMVDTGVPVSFWRSVGFSSNTYVVECFLDECAAAAGVDPLRYRQKLLSGDARFSRVVSTLAEQSGWDRPLREGRFRGMAATHCFGTYVAAVVEVQMTGASEFRLTRVWVTVDAGKLAAPDVCLAQVQGGVIFGLTAALFDRITFRDGRVEQSNFHDYRMLLLPETPRIDARFVASNAAPGGIGEVGVPCMAPALCNALFAATGKRLRSLPVSAHGLVLA